MVIQKCHICGGPGEEDPEHPNLRCYRCGKYIVTVDSFDLMKTHAERWADETIANASGWIREHPGTELNKAILGYLKRLSTPSVAEKADKLLLYLAQKYPYPGSSISLPKVDHLDRFISVSRSRPEEEFSRLADSEVREYRLLLPLMGASWSVNERELVYILNKYLCEHKRILSAKTTLYEYEMTPIGWDYVSSLRRGQNDSNTAFVAMWFDPEMESAWIDGIDKGIRDAGYDPVRIDKVEHNNKIDDEIIAAIRRAKFLVTDFTGHRGGVYFEAGFAMGLGIPVIWLCREDHLEGAHFDTRQYNFVVWKQGEHKELAARLRNRIEATIGAGEGVTT